MSAKAPTDPVDFSSEEMTSAVFVQLVMQQANLALMLLGRVPHPQTGKTEQDVDAARAFIDQLEMLEVKTKGNLNPQEAAFLKDALMSVRMAFVDAVKSEESAPEQPAPPPASDKPAPAAAEGAKPTSESTPPAPEAESRKKFAKKY